MPFQNAKVNAASQQADLQAAFSVDNPSPNVGDTITYTATITNSGPDTATNVNVSATLPAGFTFVSATPSQGSYNPISGGWTLGTVSQGSPQTLAITVKVVSSNTSFFTIFVGTADQSDPNNYNNSVSCMVTPQQADLQAAFSVNNPSPNVGDTITYTATITNSGPATATNVNVNASLPAGLTFVSATPSQGSYDSTTGGWLLGTVSPGNSRTLAITATVASPNPSTFTITVVHVDQYDPNNSNNAGAINVLVNAATPNIGTQPQNQTVTVGDSSPSLSVSATVGDGGALSYQWYSNTTNSASGGTLISSATSATYAAPTATVGTTYYYVIVTNTNNGVTGMNTATVASNAAEVTVNSLINAATPSIASQPAGATVTQNASSPTLSVTASVSDGGSLSYQWYSNTTNSASGGTLIFSATSATYAAPTATVGTTYYYVVVTNTNNGVTGTKTAMATSSTAKVTVIALVDANTPIIGTQPADQTINVGDSSPTLSVTASVSDGGSLSYQWYSSPTNSASGGTLIPSATSATYAAPTATVGTTYYYVIVTNTNNGVNGTKTAVATSSTAKVTVNTSPTTGTHSTSGTTSNSTSDPNPIKAPDPKSNLNSEADVFKSGDDNVLKNFETWIQEAKEAPTTLSFSDIKGHWTERAIDIFVMLHVIEGYNDGTFRPDNAITRAEFAVILERVFDIRGGNSISAAMNDISHHWAKDAIEKLVEAGIIVGYEDGSFKPDNTITREEMVVMLSRILNLENVAKDTTKGNFVDLKSSYAANEIIAEAQAGIIHGKTDGKFDAKSNATRAEVLQLILNALELKPQIKTLLDSLK
ncbi:S-layer homology domain-containing protein [Paenibacillus andongensis]|uniref:S-layer homology domain-containing protein n=1 Tax=Paenibacillus andongensis TaxID=2975482 RepID=UPI0021BAE6CD|nr:S-layer homology domain-containing protein [Paenibacillus andongensis]